MKTKSINELLEELRAHPETITVDSIDLLTAETKAAAKASKDAETAYFKDAEQRKTYIQDRITAARKRASEIDGQIAKLNQKIKTVAVGSSPEDLDRISGQIDELAAEKAKTLKSAKHLEGINPGGDKKLYEAVMDAVDVHSALRSESVKALYQLSEIAEAKAEELMEIANAARNSAYRANYPLADTMKVSNHYNAEIFQKIHEEAVTESAQPQRAVTNLTPPDHPQQRNVEDAMLGSHEVTVFGGRKDVAAPQVTVFNPWDHVQRGGDENDD